MTLRSLGDLLQLADRIAARVDEMAKHISFLEDEIERYCAARKLPRVCKRLQPTSGPEGEPVGSAADHAKG